MSGPIDLTRDPKIIKQDSDIESASARSMRHLIASEGLSHENCETRTSLQMLAKTALKLKTSAKKRKANDIVISSDDDDVEVDEIQIISHHSTNQSKHDNNIWKKEIPIQETSDQMECGCCFMEYSFIQLTQCTEGHLFCLECLRRYAEERLFGNSSVEKLKCMQTSSNPCNGHFIEQELKKSLPEKVYTRWVEKETIGAIREAKIQGLYSCPFCGYSVELDPTVKILRCDKSFGGCGKSSCCDCGKAAHPDTPKCSDVETDASTKKRLAIEEAMTNVRLRKCTNSNCKTFFYKTEGCNKMTCSVCGFQMCYLCRVNIPVVPGAAINAGYQHFCQTPHCNHQSCRKCPLFTNPIEDDRRAMKEAALKAQAAVTESSLSSSSTSSSTSNDLRFTPVFMKQSSHREQSGPEVNIDKLLENLPQHP